MLSEDFNHSCKAITVIGTTVNDAREVINNIKDDKISNTAIIYVSYHIKKFREEIRNTRKKVLNLDIIKNVEAWVLQNLSAKLTNLFITTWGDIELSL